MSKIKYWTNEELQLLKENYSDLNVTLLSLSNLIGKSKEAIIQKASKLNIVRYKKSEDHLQYLKDNYWNLEISHEVFEEKLNRNWNAIRFIAKKLKLKRSVSYECVSDYFDNINAWEKAYIMGLLWADGHNSVVENRITIGLQEQDKHILESISNIIQKDKPLMFKPGRMAPGYKQKSKNQYVLRISNKTISQKLLEYGMTPNKTKTLEFPTCISDQFLSAFILGYFDGDGCIYLSEKRNSFSICGTLDIITKIKEILINKCKVSDTKIRQLKNLHDIAWTKKEDIKNIRTFLYTSSTLFLQRKYDKFYSIN